MTVVKKEFAMSLRMTQTLSLPTTWRNRQQTIVQLLAPDIL